MYIYIENDNISLVQTGFVFPVLSLRRLIIAGKSSLEQFSPQVHQHFILLTARSKLVPLKTAVSLKLE